MKKIEKLFDLIHEVKNEDYDAIDALTDEIYYQLKKNRGYIAFYAKSNVNGKFYCIYELSGQTVGLHYYYGHDEVGYGEYKNTKFDHYADELIGNIACNARNLYIEF